MKHIFFALVSLFLFASDAHAQALASIYNSPQSNIGGALLVQASDNQEEFLLLPTRYKIKNSSYINEGGQFVEGKKVRHQVVTINGQRFSSYTFRMQLVVPSDEALWEAQSELRRRLRRRVRVVGLAPVCGLKLVTPGKEGMGAQTPVMSGQETFVRYSISSTEAEKCTAILDTTEFTLEYRVPILREPETAQKLMSSTGLVLPPIEIVLPYKYRDQVKVTVDAVSAINTLKAGGQMMGTIRGIGIEAAGRVSTMMNKLKISGGLTINCQNPDKTVCDNFEKLAAEALVKMLYVYTPLATNGDAEPIVLADRDKVAPAQVFRAELAYSEQEARAQGQFDVNFANEVYAGVTAHAQIELNRVPRKSIDRSIDLGVEQENSDF